VFSLESKVVLDLGVLGLDPSIVHVTVGVQLSQIAKTMLSFSVLDEPTGRLRKDHNESSQEKGGNDLNT
jgi:hypothetical protein